jgi:hypothetical protein
MVPLLFKKISLNSRFSEKGHEKNYCLGSSSLKKIPNKQFFLIAGKFTVSW